MRVLRCRIDQVTSAGVWVTAPDYPPLGPLDVFGATPTEGVRGLLLVLDDGDMAVLC